MVNAELRVLPLHIHIKSRLIAFWIKLVKTMYNIMQNELNLSPDYKQLNYIKNILISVERVDLFERLTIDSPESIKQQITQTLTDLNMQEWYSVTEGSSKVGITGYSRKV